MYTHSVHVCLSQQTKSQIIVNIALVSGVLTETKLKLQSDAIMWEIGF